MKPQDIITEARDIFQDKDPLGYRQDNDELLRYLTEAVSLAMPVRPEFFFKTIQHTCIAGALQEITQADAQALIEIQRVNAGNVVTRMNKSALDQFDPSWIAGTPGPTQQWDRDLTDAMKFWVYPPAANGQVIDAKVLPPAPVYTASNIADDMGLPGWMQAALVSYVVGRAETKDDEHVNSGRAAAMNSQFADAIKAGQGS